MGSSFPIRTGKVYRRAFIGMELLFIAVALAALADRVLNAGLGLGWITFFVAFCASAWGAAAYPLCGECCGWHKDKA